MTVVCLVVSIYFVDWIKTVMDVNLDVILLLVQAVYVGIRTCVNGYKKARGIIYVHLKETCSSLGWYIGWIEGG